MEERIAPCTGRVLHLVGNAHIDLVWLWRWQEGLQEVRATFRSALDRLAEFPAFVFTSSSAVCYEWLEQVDPDMLAEIRAQVLAGRWVLCGGWWVQPDCNIPHGESFVRQALLGQRTFMRLFGLHARVGYNVDSFGHNAALPQLLAGSGMEGYVFLRPGPHECVLPAEVFRWIGPDGSSVAAARIPDEYTVWGANLLPHVHRCVARLSEENPAGICFYGVGNHGGGPTRENIGNLEEERLPMAEAGVSLRFSSPDQFFLDLASRGTVLPEVSGDLLMHAPGCLSVHAGVKRWNRRAEHALLDAEKWVSLAGMVFGHETPEDLNRAWRQILFNQFHDVLAGTSIEAAYEDAREQYGEACSIAARARNAALQGLLRRIGMPSRDRSVALVVFNGATEAAYGPVAFELEWKAETSVMRDVQGRSVPVQRIAPRSLVGGRQRFVFVPALPAFGYETFWLEAVASPAASGGGAERVIGADGGEAVARAPETAADAADTTALSPIARMASDGSIVMDNGIVRLMIAADSGLPVSLRLLPDGPELLAAPGAVPVVVEDDSDTWSHHITRYADGIGAFAADAVVLEENGPVRATVRVGMRWGESRMLQRFSLCMQEAAVRVSTTVDWHERWKLLKLCFTPALTDVSVRAAIPFGGAPRADNGDEQPMQDWADVTGTVSEAAGGGDAPPDRPGRAGLTVLNDGRHGMDFRNGTLRLTVLRSPVYAHHVPVAAEAGQALRFMDQGEQTAQWMLLPHDGTQVAARAVAAAVRFQQPPFVLFESTHAGALPLRLSGIGVNRQFPPDAQCPSETGSRAASVSVSAIKPAEDGHGWVLRAHETGGVQVAGCRFELPVLGRSWVAGFTPHQIRTFFIPSAHDAPVRDMNLIEEALP